MRCFLVAVLVMAASLSGCRREGIAPPAPADAGGSPVTAQTVQPAPADAGDSAVDLLHYPGASIAVSSNVDNPRDFPEHLVDGREDTAWNGRSGDLAGAWIAFRVPESAHVSRIEMSAGFDKTNADGDLFTMNHRITRVRIKRGRVVIKEHTFDTSVRTPQAIAIDAAGGSYRIEILETLPGSKTTWREACVSELRVMGPVPNDVAAAQGPPPVAIGSFANEAPRSADLEPGATERALAPLMGRGFPSIAALCRAWDAVIGPVLDRWRSQGITMIPKQHACTSRGPIGAGFTPNAEIKSVTRVTLFQENWSEERLVIETSAGFFLPEGEPVDTHSFNDPGCFGSTTVTVLSVRATGSVLEVLLGRRWKNRRYLYEADGGVEAVSDSDDLSTERDECALSGSKMKCVRKVVQRVCHVDKSVVPCDSF